MCENRSWNSSRLLLALPYANQAKSNVILKTFVQNTGGAAMVHSYSSTRPLSGAEDYRYIVSKWGHLERWFYNQMSAKVRHVTNATDLSVWLATGCTTTDVCLLLVSSLTLPPVLLSALSVRFTGRVRVGMASPDVVSQVLGVAEPEGPPQEPDAEPGPDPQTGFSDEAKPDGFRNGQFMIFSPAFRLRLRQYLTRNSSTSSAIGCFNCSSSAVIGFLKRGLCSLVVYNEDAFYDRVSFVSLGRWLRWLTPDLNDIFVFSLALVNIFAIMSVFDYAPPLSLVSPRYPRSSSSFFSGFLLPLAGPFLNLAIVFLKYNLFFLLVWLVLLACSQLNATVDAGRLVVALLREASLSTIGRRCIRDFELLLSNVHLTVATAFIVFTGCVKQLTNWYSQPNGLQQQAVAQQGSDLNNAEALVNADIRARVVQRISRARQRGRPSLFDWLAQQRLLQYVDEYQRHLQSEHERAVENVVAELEGDDELELYRNAVAAVESDWVSVSSDEDFTSDSSVEGVDSLNNTSNPHLRALVQQLQADLPSFSYRGSSSGSYDYILELPVWKTGPSCPSSTPEEAGGTFCGRSLIPEQQQGVPSTDYSCAICLEPYDQSCELCALPCAHTYHRNCLFSWLLRDQRNCPICRWPSDKPKIKAN